MDTRYQVNFVAHRIDHHAAHSGYHRLSDYVAGGLVVSRLSAGQFSWMPWRFKKNIFGRSKIKWYNEARFLGELSILPHLVGKKREIIHFLYGDDSYCYAGSWPRSRGKKIVATFHHTPQCFEEFVTRKGHIEKLDAVITVGTNQVEFFRNLTRRDNVFFVPHGVDTDFFSPDKQSQRDSSRTCLFVGQWLRDFEMMRKVIQIVTSKNKDIQFKIVTHPQRGSYFNSLPQTLLHSLIDEQKLLELYREASLLTIPLVDCTGNNSILEALACGLPVVTTSVGGVRDYLDESCGIFVKTDDAQAMAERIVELMNNGNLRRSMELAARKKALNYSWPVVAKEVERVYAQVLEKTSS